MSVITGLKNIKNKMERPQSEDGTRARWLKLMTARALRSASLTNLTQTHQVMIKSAASPLLWQSTPTQEITAERVYAP